MKTARTQLRLGPKDDGRELSFEDYIAADCREGYQYELIDGRLYVSPLPNLPYNSLELWIFTLLFIYSQKRPDIINLVTMKSRVFVPGRSRLTAPEPDVAAYSDFPLRTRFTKRNWRKVSPILAVEVVSVKRPNKDLVRNVELYEQVPSIAEYWIIDPRPNPDEPKLIVYRKRAGKWMTPIEVPFGETYTTRLLPGFRLLVDPHVES